MLASVKEEHLSPTNHQQQQLMVGQPLSSSASVANNVMMNKEEVHTGGISNNNATNTSTTGSMNASNMMNSSSISPNVISPNYQNTQNTQNNMDNNQQQQQNGYYPPIHHHQQYHGSYGHHYPQSQQMNNTLPSLNSTSYGVTTPSEGYIPNPPTNTSNVLQTSTMQQPPQYSNNMDNVQQGVSMYQQQSQLASSNVQSQNSNATANNMNSINNINNTQLSQNASSSQQPVSHTIFHEYQTHKKSNSPVNENNSGEYHPIACIPCRKRHKKCDRLLPKCSECGKRGIDCQYYEPKQKGRKKKDDAPNSSEFSPQPSSPINTPSEGVSHQQQYATSQTPTSHNNNFQQNPSFNQQMQGTLENSSASFQTRERSASYQKYRSEPYPSVNRHDLPALYNSNGMNSSTNVTPQRERAVSSASSSNYYSLSYYNANGMNSQSTTPMNNNNGVLTNLKSNSVSNQYLQPNRVSTSSSSPDSSNEANLPPYARFVPIEKEKLKEQLYIRRGELESWDTFRISQWIDTLDASFTSHNVGELFKHHDIDGLAFLGLHNQILLEMGIAKVGVRLRLVRIIDHLRLQN